MKTGGELIATERQEQILKHNRTVLKDTEVNDNGELIMAAKAMLNQKEDFITVGDFPASWDKYACEKMAAKRYKERLVIAGALIAAEIDRIQAFTNGS